MEKRERNERRLEHGLVRYAQTGAEATVEVECAISVTMTQRPTATSCLACKTTASVLRLPHQSQAVLMLNATRASWRRMNSVEINLRRKLSPCKYFKHRIFDRSRVQKTMVSREISLLRITVHNRIYTPKRRTNAQTSSSERPAVWQATEPRTVQLRQHKKTRRLIHPTFLLLQLQRPVQGFGTTLKAEIDAMPGLCLTSIPPGHLKNRSQDEFGSW